MNTKFNLTTEEEQVAKRINSYFKPGDMSFQEKLFHALLIAQNELDGHHFSTEYERLRILQFKSVLDSLHQKFCGNYVNRLE